MDKGEMFRILKLLHKCPIKTWADLSEDASQIDVWNAQAEWIRNEWNTQEKLIKAEMDKMCF